MRMRSDYKRWLVLSSMLSATVLSWSCDETRTEHFENEGSACLVPSEQGTRFTTDASVLMLSEDEPVSAHVVFSKCESYCAEVEHAECEATVDDDVIHIQARARTRVPTSGDCPDECLRVDTTCSVGALPAGEYTVEYGDSTRTVEIAGADSCP